MYSYVDILLRTTMISELRCKIYVPILYYEGQFADRWKDIFGKILYVQEKETENYWVC